MLTLHDCTPSYKSVVADLSASQLPSNVTWIDILDGSDEEIAFARRVTGRDIPERDALSEIESSSRLRCDNGALYLSTPIVSRAQTGAPRTTPVGLVVTKAVLITIRYTPLTAFDTFAEDYAKQNRAHLGGAGAFVGLLDAIIDRAADVLEYIGADLDHMSQRVFTREPHKRKPPAREDASLRETLQKIGCSGDLTSKIRDSLLGLSRIVSYASGMGSDCIPVDLRGQLDTQRHDIASLSDYDAHLNGKVQLLLDATMGLINIEQNNIVKVLTIVSVVGVPPTLIASMYGMNFHNMPEYSWTWGYQYGLVMILLSAILPLCWFKWRGWI